MEAGCLAGGVQHRARIFLQSSDVWIHGSGTAQIGRVFTIKVDRQSRAEGRAFHAMARGQHGQWAGRIEIVHQLFTQMLAQSHVASFPSARFDASVTRAIDRDLQTGDICRTGIDDGRLLRRCNQQSRYQDKEPGERRPHNPSMARPNGVYLPFTRNLRLFIKQKGCTLDIVTGEQNTNMINPVSNQTAHHIPVTQPTTQQTSATKQQQPKQDSVQLSPQAKAAASGDVDHDGDSH